MKRICQATAPALAAVLLTACGAPPPVDFGGNWQPVNRFQDKPQAIPLSPAYTYYASPLDGTLRGMLRRWANDNAMPLVWQINSDYTLYKAVADLRATDLQTAVSELNRVYAGEGIFITADIERILVQSPSAAAASSANANANASVAAPGQPASWPSAAGKTSALSGTTSASSTGNPASAQPSAVSAAGGTGGVGAGNPASAQPASAGNTASVPPPATAPNTASAAAPAPDQPASAGNPASARPGAAPTQSAAAAPAPAKPLGNIRFRPVIVPAVPPLN